MMGLPRLPLQVYRPRARASREPELIYGFIKGFKGIINFHIENK